MVWVIEMAGYQIGSDLLETTSAARASRRTMRRCRTARSWPILRPVRNSFHLTDRREFVVKEKGLAITAGSPFEAPSKPGAGAGAGTSSGTGKPTASSAAKLPPCPHDDIVAIYHEVLPELPGVKLMGKSRARRRCSAPGLGADQREAGQDAPRDQRQEALGWFRDYFDRARDNDFLMGRTPRTGEHANWKCDLDFLLTDKGMRHVIEKTGETDR
jgi:hypothetical protein